MARLRGLLCVLVLSIASAAGATVLEEPICCFCAVDEGIGQVPFCGLIASRSQESEIQDQCLEQGGLGLKCLLVFNGQSEQSESTCNAALEEEGVNCPLRSGAPTASVPALGLLAVVLTAVGVAAVRRRRPSSGG